MLTARLLKNASNKYYCSNCRVIQQKLRAECFFCNAIFSNYEEIQLKLYNDKQKGDIYEIQL